MLQIKRQEMIVDMARGYEVYIDGVRVGTVSNGQTKDFEMNEGHHLVYVKMDWCRSKKIGLDVKKNEVVVLHARNSMKWCTLPFLYFLKLTFFRKSYLSLTEEKVLKELIESVV